MREKFYRFMAGRNGMDALAKAENTLILILLIISIFTRLPFLYPLAILLMVHMYFRVFSKNTAKRYQENQTYVNFRYRVITKIHKMKKEFADRKVYRFYRCPMCKQKVRVPKGRGRIAITCPKCREEFIRKS